MWETLERARPFAGMDNFQIQTTWLYRPEEMRLPPLRVPDSASPSARRLLAELQRLVADCTRVEPEERPSFREVLVRIRAMQSSEQAPSADAAPA